MSQASPQDDLLDGVHIASDTDLRGLPVQAVATDAGGRSRQSLAREALRWTYVLRSRQRWVHDALVREQHQADARDTLAQFGLGTTQLRSLARASTLVVRVPYQHEALGWEARVFPWEYVLAAATREQRRGATGRPEPLTVIREL